MTASVSHGCGKTAHPDRRTARRVARLFPSHHLRAYRCPNCRFFHLGHLAPAILQGRLTARELYGPTTREVTQP